jgi:hypothetical protein
LVAAADLVPVEATAVSSVAPRASCVDHPSDIAGGHAEAGGQLVAPAVVEGGGPGAGRVTGTG